MTSSATPQTSGRDAAPALGASRPSLRGRLTCYYSLTKPGVLYGNVLTAAAGFLLASARGGVDPWLFLALVTGSTLVIASACVLNNALDRDIDSAMQRTCTRATVTGSVSARRAVAFSAALGMCGLAVLVVGTNWLVVATGLGGFSVYVVFYGMLSKRRSIHGTLVGSISGAAPILAGYLAVSARIDRGAIVVFLMILLWQMPEFYSIAIYRREEYARADVPVISVVKGVRHTAVQILAYTIAFVAACLLLPAFGYVGVVYTIVMGGLGLYWIWLGALGLRTPDVSAWAYRMFRFSLVMILALCLMITIGPIVP